MINGYGMQVAGMSMTPSDMMGVPQQYQVQGQGVRTEAPLAAYTSREKDDNAIKVGVLGAFAIAVGAMITKGKGIKGVSKAAKNIEKTAEAIKKEGIFSKAYSGFKNIFKKNFV